MIMDSITFEHFKHIQKLVNAHGDLSHQNSLNAVYQTIEKTYGLQGTQTAKSITVHIEDDLYTKLREDAGLVAFVEDCVGISTADRCMHRIIQKIDSGEREVTLSFTKKEKP